MHTYIKLDPPVAAIIGALVADSASLGLHWLYDPIRIARIEKSDGLVFLEPKAEFYANTKGFFAHRNKCCGDSSGYGEICLQILKHIAKHGKFLRNEYQTEYCSYFGPGGEYIGYIDSPTRLTLRTLLSLNSSEYPEKSGADDDQFAALATIPVLVAVHEGTQNDLMQRVDEVVRITNNNDIAVAAAQYAAAVLFNVLNAIPIKQALVNALPLAGNELMPLLKQALSVKELDSVEVAKRFGAACHVMEGLPVIVHIAQLAPDYRSAIEANIRAGGDSCGRSILLGSILSAQSAKQIKPAPAIPLEWLAKYRNLSEAANACAEL